MINIVDKVNGYLIQKVLHNKTGVLVRYQTVPADKVGNSYEVSCYSTLKAARMHAQTGVQQCPGLISPLSSPQSSC